MRTCAMILALLFGVPLMAQASGDGAKPTKTAEKTAEAKPEVKQPEMTDEGKKLFADFERVYKKYYELVLAKTKSNETYKAASVWDEAVKEAQNAKYEDHAAFSKAVQAMARKDRVFKKKRVESMNKLAKDHAEKVRKWAESKK